MKTSLDWLWNGFEEIADAPNGTARLREMILSLAIQGRLVPQNADDEPASELLKRIKGEKARLVQEGKIRKSAPLPPVSEDEVPFEIPASWAWVRLGGVSDSRLGKMLDQHKNKGNLYPYLRNTNVQWLRFELDDLKQMRFEESELEEFAVIEGDLLVCEGGEPGRCAIWCGSDPVMFQKAIHRVRPFNQLDSQYILYNLLRDARSGNLGSYFTGATIKHFTGQALNRYVFPLPPLAEQKRIVEKVDELMALCDELGARQKQKREGRSLALRATLAQLERAADPDEFTLRLSLLADHFEELLDAPESVAPLRAAILSLAVRGRLEPQDPDDEPVSTTSQSLFPDSTSADYELGAISWKTMTIEEACSHIVDCLHSTPVFTKEGFLCVDTTCISPGKIHFDRARYVTEESFKDRTRRLLPMEGDIIFSREGTVGTAVRVPTNTELCLGQRMMMYRPQKFVDSEYFLRFLMSHAFQTQLFAKMTGTASKHVNIGEIRKMWIIIPPLAEQKRIVARVDELMALCDELEAGLKARQSDGATFVEAAVRSVSRRGKEEKADERHLIIS